MIEKEVCVCYGDLKVI